jgi:sugar-specific transcriptional regulator TrmB
VWKEPRVSLDELDNTGLSSEHVQTLTQLGLSRRQARVYLALLISGTSTAKAISKVSRVPRQDIYTVMPALEKMGLCEVAIAKPVMFRATPLRKGLELLMQCKSAEYEEIRVKTRNLLDGLEHYNRGTRFQEDKTEFFLLPAMHERVLMIEEAVSNARNAVDSFTTPKILRQALVSSKETLMKTLKRGVPFRFLVEDLKSEDLQLEIPKAVLKSPRFEVRYVTVPVPAAAVLIDKKEIFFGTTIDFQKATYLWSNNPYLVGIVQNYFETIWNYASKNA